jgi:hypothetical protein
LACVVVVCGVVSYALADATIDSTTVEARRATFKGKTDASHELVVRMDRDDKPIEWRSGGGGDSFEVAVHASDEIPVEGGKTGHGFVVTTKVGSASARSRTDVTNVALGGDLDGAFAIRTKAEVVTKDGVTTFADVTLKDGKKLPVSFRLERKTK